MFRLYSNDIYIQENIKEPNLNFTCFILFVLI